MAKETLDAEQVELEEAAAFEEGFMAEFPSVEESEEGADGGEETEDNSGTDATEDESEEDESEGDEKNDAEEADAGDSKDAEGDSKKPKEGDDESKATLKKAAEEIGDGKKVKLPAGTKYPDLQEGDYVESADGKFVVKSEFLASDIKSIVEQDASVFLKIFKSKPTKAEAIAKIIGVKPDTTRSAGRVFADVVTALKTATPEQATALVAAHIPSMADPNGEVPFSFDVKALKKEEAELDGQAVVSGADLINASYRVVAERTGEIKLEDVLDSPEVATAYAAIVTDNKGNELGVYERLSLAVEQVFPKGEAKAEGKTKEDKGDDPRGASAAGSGAGGTRKSAKHKDAGSAESEAFEAALKEGM